MGWSPTSDDRAMRWRSQSMKRKNPGVDAGRILVDGLHGGYRVRQPMVPSLCPHPPVAAQGLESTDWPQSAARNWSSPCRTSWFRLARTHFTPPPISQGTTGMYEQLALYIDGEFLAGEGRRTQDVINPATLEVLGQLPHATEADLDRALAAAQRAFESWKKSSHGPFRHPAQGRPAVARARKGNRPQHDPGPGQAAGRGRGRSLVLRRARRLARRGMPPHLRPRDPAAQPGRAPDRGARAHRRVRCLHALELPLQPGHPQDRRRAGRGLHRGAQGSRGFAVRRHGDRAHVP